MIKKLIALAATALFSLDASAGYVQYNFNGPVSGFFIQRDDDQSLAYFDFAIEIQGMPPESRQFPYSDHFYPLGPTGEGGVFASGPTTYFHNNGPTNLVGYDNNGADHDVRFSINFSRGTEGNFNYTAQYAGWIYLVPTSWQGSGTFTGTVSESKTDFSFSTDLLDSMGGHYSSGEPNFWFQPTSPEYIGPGHLPEPASLTLFAVGALGAGGVARRRKKAI